VHQIKVQRAQDDIDCTGSEVCEAQNDTLLPFPEVLGYKLAFVAFSKNQKDESGKTLKEEYTCNR
jgi:hypothetical protein